jgi:predicted DNA-binding protein (UPF0251 family)
MNLNPVLTKFLNKQNLKLLWDVLLDELLIDPNNKPIITNIRTVFESNIQPFTKNTSINTNLNGKMQLVNLNKQFLSQVLIAVNRLFPNLKQEQDFKRIQISSEEVSPYKIEDIREVRQDNFEKQVSIKRADFENYLNLNKPKELDFSEKIDDDKITEMDTLIAETVARRKFDIEQIQNTVVTEDPENWLQPQKITNTNINTNVKEVPNPDLSIYRKLKLKQINENTVISTNQKKNVSWDDENKSNISLFIEEIQEKQEIPTDKIDILMNKVDILIDLMTKMVKQSDPLVKQTDPLVKQTDINL